VLEIDFGRSQRDEGLWLVIEGAAHTEEEEEKEKEKKYR
jgi:hypothetical protein